MTRGDAMLVPENATYPASDPDSAEEILHATTVISGLIRSSSVGPQPLPSQIISGIPPRRLLAGPHGQDPLAARIVTGELVLGEAVKRLLLRYPARPSSALPNHRGFSVSIVQSFPGAAMGTYTMMLLGQALVRSRDRYEFQSR